MIDLHVHTTASDGQYTPSQIIEFAHDKNIGVIAITDHDTVAGIDEGRKAAKKLGHYKHVHCHLARHTFATTCITIGIPLPATSKLLGHRNLDTTLIYAKYVDTFLDKEMKKFDRLR